MQQAATQTANMDLQAMQNLGIIGMDAAKTLSDLSVKTVMSIADILGQIGGARAGGTMAKAGERRASFGDVLQGLKTGAEVYETFKNPISR
jgi:hypothetical protein